MSEPKRMTFTSRALGGGETSKTEWVSLADYERLKAEVDEARRGSGAGMGVMLDLNNQLVSEIDRLQAEVENLRNSAKSAAKEGQTK